MIIDRDFNVIAGHGRILAAKEENIPEVPCVFADHLTEAQKKAYSPVLIEAEFTSPKAELKYDDPVLQAEYAYGLIESGVSK